MLHYYESIIQMLNTYQVLILPVAALASIALCFLGFRFLQVWVAAFGFILGLGGGYIVASRFLTGYAPLLVGFLAGVIMILLSFMIFKAGIFAFIAAITGMTLWKLIPMWVFEEIYLPGSVGLKIAKALPYVLVLLVSLTVGALAVKKMRNVIIAATGITGAFEAVLYVMSILHVSPTLETRYIWLAIIALLAILGIVVQVFTTKK